MDHRLKTRKDHRGVDLISDALPFGRLWYDGPNAASNAIGRDQPAEPLAITIVNAKDVFSPAKILSVKRDDSGKLSGAVIEPIS